MIVSLNCCFLDLTLKQGGYNFKSISKSALAVTKTLMGEPPDRLLSSSPTDSAVAAVRRVRSIQSNYWSRLYPKTTTHPVYGNRLHGNNDRLLLLDRADELSRYPPHSPVEPAV